MQAPPQTREAVVVCVGGTGTGASKGTPRNRELEPVLVVAVGHCLLVTDECGPQAQLLLPLGLVG